MGRAEYTLRELERTDVETINGWRAKRELIDCLGAPFRYIGSEIDEAWFEGYLESRSSTVRCAIVKKEEPNNILGLITLASINWINRSCVLHIMVGAEADCGKGLGTFAVDEMLYHAFNDLNLARVELNVLADNERAQHLYTKFGFIVEGTRRKAAYKNGRYQDMLVMGLLKDEWVH